MDWFAPVDLYCERLGPAFWAEPVNALSNIAFLIASGILFGQSRARPADGEVRALSALVGVVGIGSFLFHSFANPLAELADVLPIALFVLTYIWVSFRRFLGWGTGKTLLAMGVFLGLGPVMARLPEGWQMNGSVSYLPCLGMLLFQWTQIRRAQPLAARRVLVAALTFVLSLTLRSLDMQLCSLFPLGTHFLWHCFNGLVLYLLVLAVMRKD